MLGNNYNRISNTKLKNGLIDNPAIRKSKILRLFEIVYTGLKLKCKIINAPE